MPPFFDQSAAAAELRKLADEIEAGQAHVYDYEVERRVDHRSVVSLSGIVVRDPVGRSRVTIRVDRIDGAGPTPEPEHPLRKAVSDYLRAEEDAKG